MKQLICELWMTGHAVSPETPQYIVMKDEWVLAPTSRGQQGDFIAVMEQGGFFCLSFSLSIGHTEIFLNTVLIRRGKWRTGAQVSQW